MIVNDGLVLLEDVQLAFMATLEFGLFTTDVTITDATVAADVTATEAAWAGYARTTATSWPTPTITGSTASSQNGALLNFGNTSGSNQTFFGWFAIDPASGDLVAADNTGAIIIPSSGVYSFASVLTDTDAG